MVKKLPLLRITFIAPLFFLLTPPHLPAAEPTPQNTSTSSAPFLAITHDEALALAKAENKPLLLFFDGHWSERAREVRPEIFSTPAVITALNDHALALRIDVLTAPGLTKHYRIFHVPTLVWVQPNGTARRYWVNCEKPAAIRAEIVETLTRLPKLRASTRPDNPAGRFQLARACYDAGDYSTALAEIRWLYLEAIGDAGATSARKKKDRVSVFEVIKLLDDVAAFHNSARETVVEFLQHEEQKIRAAPTNHANATAALKFWRLAQIVHAHERVDSLLVSLPPGPARDALAKRIAQVSSK